MWMGSIKACMWGEGVYGCYGENIVMGEYDI